MTGTEGASRHADAPLAGGAPETHFGYATVREDEKARRVAGVFDSVASSYDRMNDLMSAGLHRAWKAFAVRQAALRPGMRVLDVAGGTGDLARAFAPRVAPGGEVWLTDVNAAMLAIGRDRLLDDGRPQPVAQCDAESLPFPDRYFDRVIVAFGLRNMTRKDAALREMHRVLAPGGRLQVLEFSRVWQPLAPAYDAYSFGVLPALGKAVAGDADSYRYLAESIRMHPDQPTLADMMRDAGFERVRWFNLSLGVVALPEGVRF
jgi:demethylmenaquinone methyltransferase/2-methoxy-6-polyprenyl-1,4-benzoquinol methylase